MSRNLGLGCGSKAQGVPWFFEWKSAACRTWNSNDLQGESDQVNRELMKV